MKQRIRSAIFGLCVADALGVPVEFQSRAALDRNPVTGMRGHGTHNQPAGTWSDDSSMTLALLSSLANGLDYEDIMRRFYRWLDKGEYSPYGSVFDVGITCRAAIRRFVDHDTDPIDCGSFREQDNGNGSLMRILPLLFYLHARFGDNFWQHGEAAEIIHNVSALTHAHPRSQAACGIYLSIGQALMGGGTLDESVRLGTRRAFDYYEQRPRFAAEMHHYHPMLAGDFAATPRAQIKGSGYVVDTLNAAVWCLLNGKSYAESALLAVNLGEDTDTVAAVAGGLAGLYYGLDGIPADWIALIPRREWIAALCDGLGM